MTVQKAVLQEIIDERLRRSNKEYLDTVAIPRAVLHYQGNFTIAVITCEGYQYAGAAKRNPDDDQWHPTGEKLALHRAAQRLVDEKGEGLPF